MNAIDSIIYYSNFSYNFKDNSGNLFNIENSYLMISNGYIRGRVANPL